MITQGFYETFARTVVLVVSPHPDDSVLGAGGLIQRLTDRVAWTRDSGLPEDEWPIVYTIVMTSGSRGVDDQYLRLYLMGKGREKNEGLADYVARRAAGAPPEPERDHALAHLCEEIRHQESQAEARILQVRERFFLSLRGIYEQHTITPEDRTVARDLICSLSDRHPDMRRLVLVPHRDDVHPVHKLSTTLVADIIEKDLVWRNTTVWQYESPWVNFSPHQIEIVVPFDGIAMATKAEAMAVHRSQEYRTKYSDIARYRAQMMAETFPELLGGFGQSGHRWDYVEAFQELRPVVVLGASKD